MSKSTEINELAVALVGAQGEFSAVPKGSVNPFFKSKYAGLPEVVASASPVLAKHGLAVSQFIGVDSEGRDILTTYLIHASGQYISHDMRLHLGKDDTSQALGSSVTYARRYSYCAVLGLVADEDDDGNASTQASFTKTTTSAPAPKASPKATQSSLGDAVATAAGRPVSSNSGGNMATEKMTRMIWAICHKTLEWDDAQQHDFIDEVTGRMVPKLEQLTFDEAKQVIEKLQALQN